MTGFCLFAQLNLDKACSFSYHGTEFDSRLLFLKELSGKEKLCV
jgi:hypothetical protein